MTGSWSGAVDAASLGVTALGLAAGGLVLARTRMLGPALAVLMEMLTGAGLLRLAAAPTLTRALGAGGVLLVRRLAILGLRADPLATLLSRLRQSVVELGRRLRALQRRDQP